MVSGPPRRLEDSTWLRLTRGKMFHIFDSRSYSLHHFTLSDSSEAAASKNLSGYIFLYFTD